MIIVEKTILEQQTFLKGLRREKVKNNAFITSIPEKLNIHQVEVTDKTVILDYVFNYINNGVTREQYKIEKIFGPAQGRTRHSAKIIFNTFESKMAIIKNCKKLGTLNIGNPLKKIYVRFDVPLLTRQENKRLSDKLYELSRSDPDGATYKIQKGKLLKDDTQIDEFNLINQIFA